MASLCLKPLITLRAQWENLKVAGQHLATLAPPASHCFLVLTLSILATMTFIPFLKLFLRHLSLGPSHLVLVMAESLSSLLFLPTSSISGSILTWKASDKKSISQKNLSSSQVKCTQYTSTGDLLIFSSGT